MAKPQINRGGVALSRRERVRQATLNEIKQIARGLLVTYGPAGVSLRAIAREMGMTASGLYRYVSGIESLLAVLTSDLFDELSEAVTAADASVPGEDTDRRILTSLRAFRSWSLEHPAEFATMFTPHTQPSAEADAACVQEAGQRFGATFFTLFARLVAEERFELPASEGISADFARALRAFAESTGFSAPGIPIESIKVLSSCWVRLYGVVSMEVFKRRNFPTGDMELLFESELHDILTGLGVRYEPPDSTGPGTGGAV